MNNTSRDRIIKSDVSQLVNWQTDGTSVWEVLRDCFLLLGPFDNSELYELLNLLAERLGLPFSVVLTAYRDYVISLAGLR